MNMAKVTIMIETAVICQRNMLFEIKIIIRLSPRLCTVSDAMIKDGCGEETSKFSALSGCTYNNEICFVCIELKSSSCLRDRSVSAVDKDMYTWVSSAYK